VDVKLYELLTSTVRGESLVSLQRKRERPRNTLNRRMGEPQRRCGCGGEEKNHCYCWVKLVTLVKFSL
jgi:hypothetical protein